jgi:hypothetical protein
MIVIQLSNSGQTIVRQWSFDSQVKAIMPAFAEASADGVKQLLNNG